MSKKKHKRGSRQQAGQSKNSRKQQRPETTSDVTTMRDKLIMALKLLGVILPISYVMAGVILLALGLYRGEVSQTFIANGPKALLISTMLSVLFALSAVFPEITEKAMRYRPRRD